MATTDTRPNNHAKLYQAIASETRRNERNLYQLITSGTKRSALENWGGDGGGVVQEVGVIDRTGHLDHPVFLLKDGAHYIVKVVLAAGHGRRWVPLPIAGADFLSVSLGDGPKTRLEVTLLPPPLLTSGSPALGQPTSFLHHLRHSDNWC